VIRRPQGDHPVPKMLKMIMLLRVNIFGPEDRTMITLAGPAPANAPG
jgi:hypothetical protein